MRKSLVQHVNDYAELQPIMWLRRTQHYRPMCACPRNTKYTSSHTIPYKKSYFKIIIKAIYINDEILFYNDAILQARYISQSHIGIAYVIANGLIHPTSTSVERVYNKTQVVHSTLQATRT